METTSTSLPVRGIAAPGPPTRAATPAQLRRASMTADFERVFRADRDRLVRALSLSLGDASLAAEAVDEAFTRALHRWHVVGEFDNPEAWIYRTARNWAISRFRRRSRDRKYAPALARGDHAEDQLPDPELTAALAQLDEDRRNVLVLRYFLDWSVDQVADALDISPGTVKSRTHRALADLEARLGGPR